MTGVQFTPSTNAVAVYDPFEVTIMPATAAAGNPFTGCDVRGWLQAENGPRLIVDGFCDAADGSLFRIRFLPATPGHYTYGVTFHTRGGTAEHTGTFFAEAAGRRGILRADPDAPWHFQWSGTGEHCFLNGTTAYYLGGWDEPQMQAAIERLYRLGINRLRVALSVFRPVDGQEWCEPVYPSEHFTFLLAPWECAHPEAVGDPGWDVTRFHVPWWQKFERLVEYTRQRDIIVSVLFYLDGQKPGADPFGKAHAGGEDERRYYRYASARLAAFSNISWDVTNEYHLFRDDAWVETMGTFLRQCDPYRHLISVHGFGEFHFRQSAWAGYASYQAWDESGGYGFMLENRRLQAETGRPLPQINEEYGYEDHYPIPWGFGRTAPARNADNRRRLAWEITMAGGYQTTGERADTGIGGWINGGSDDSTTLLSSHLHMRQFFERLPWWRLEPRPDLGSGEAFCLAEEGRCYVLYLPSGRPTTVTLPSGIYSATRSNPRTGAHQTLTEVSGPQWTTPAMPDDEDWALCLQFIGNQAGIDGVRGEQGRE